MSAVLEADLDAPGPSNPEPTPRPLKVRRSRGDRIFRILAVAGGCSTLLIMGLIGFFLVYKAIGPLRDAGWHFLTTFEWIPDGIEGQSPPLFGIGAMLDGTPRDSSAGDHADDGHHLWAARRGRPLAPRCRPRAGVAQPAKVLGNTLTDSSGVAHI